MLVELELEYIVFQCISGVLRKVAHTVFQFLSLSGIYGLEMYDCLALLSLDHTLYSLNISVRGGLQSSLLVTYASIVSPIGFQYLLPSSRCVIKAYLYSIKKNKPTDNWYNHLQLFIIN